MADQPILILGATGSTGRRVAARLKSAGHLVREAARHTTTRFDWTDRSTWRPALTGTRAVYLMAPHHIPVEEAFIHEAVEQGVERLVLLSSRAIEEMADHRLLTAERLVKASNVDWTIIRPDWFNQNFDEGFFRPAIAAGELTLPVGDTAQGFVDADDIAAVAATALTEDGHQGRTYELTGPRTLTFTEALTLIATATNRPITFRGTPDDYRAHQAARNAPPHQTEQEIAAYSRLKTTTPTTDVATVTGQQPVDFARYATRVWAAGR